MEGKVKSITKFGAFISLPGNQTGMVHISEIAHAYVSDIHEHLTEGQDVKVMVISMENGKINLSIKRTQEPPRQQNERGPRPAQANRGRPPFDRSKGPQSDRPRDGFRSSSPKEPQSFDDMLKQFMQDSDSKISSLMYSLFALSSSSLSSPPIASFRVGTTIMCSSSLPFPSP